MFAHLVAHLAEGRLCDAPLAHIHNRWKRAHEGIRVEAIYADQGLARVANRVLRARRSSGSTLGAPLASLALATTSVVVASDRWRL